MRVLVKNKRTYNGEGVYVGRPSAFGNPYRMRTEADRAKVIRQYDAWLEKRLSQRTSKQSKAMTKLVKKLKRDEKMVLLCWCTPKRCHAHIIRQHLLRRIEASK